jgi:hypothetical protein
MVDVCPHWKQHCGKGAAMSDPAAAEEAAVNLLARAEAAAGEEGEDPTEEQIAAEVAAEVEELEHDASGNISRGCPAAAEYAFVEAVKGHLKTWGY